MVVFLKILESFLRTEKKRAFFSIPRLFPIRKTNQIRSMGIQLSRFWRHFELYWQVQLQEGESPLDYETYTREVVQCGLSWSF